MTADSGWFVLFLVGVLICLMRVAPDRQHPQERTADTTSGQRLLKPRTPHDCSNCRLQTTLEATTPLRPPVTPWRDQKSRRGAPKRIATPRFACSNRMCAYYRITDAQI